MTPRTSSSMTQRKYIKPGTQVSFELSTRERDLVAERASLDPETLTLERRGLINRVPDKARSVTVQVLRAEASGIGVALCLTAAGPVGGYLVW